MARSRDLLNRFRPTGTPGAAATSGVPADRVAELSAELQPVFAALAATEEEARRIRAEAVAEAERRRAAAAEQARTLLAEAHRQAEAERAAAAARITGQARAEADQTIAAGEQAAEEVRRRVAERLPAYVARVVESVRAEVGAEPP